MSERQLPEETDPLPGPIDNLVVFIAERTADRPHPRLRMATLYDEDKSRYILTRYSGVSLGDEHAVNRIAGIQVSTPFEGADESESTTLPQDKDEGVMDHLVLREADGAISLAEVTYDEASDYIIDRYCTDEEVATLLEKLERALEFTRQQRVKAKGRMSEAAIRSTGV